MGTRCRAIVVVLLLAAAPAWGWWADGHGVLTRAAVRATPEMLPAFFREGADLVAHCAYDPDVIKLRDVPGLRRTEEPEHYLDKELLGERPLPPQRYDFLRLCAELRLDPHRVGTLPYAVAEGTERLAVAFAEHLKWPRDRFIQQKCLVYAGIVAHYAQDLCQPLHTTIHFDGRARPDGTSPRSGIHERVDALIERLALTPADLGREQRVEPLADPFAGIVAELGRSHALVDRVYELENELPPRDVAASASWRPSAAIRAFGTERARASVRFTAQLYLTAWQKSASIRLPDWLDRTRLLAPPARSRDASDLTGTARLEARLHVPARLGGDDAAVLEGILLGADHLEVDGAGVAVLMEHSQVAE